MIIVFLLSLVVLHRYNHLLVTNDYEVTNIYLLLINTFTSFASIEQAD